MQKYIYIYHGVLKPLPVPDKKWVHISIDSIIDFPVKREIWGKICINIMVMANRLNKMIKYIFMDGITTKNAAKKVIFTFRNTMA